MCHMSKYIYSAMYLLIVLSSLFANLISNYDRLKFHEIKDI